MLHITIILLTFGMLAIIGGFFQFKRKQLIENTPTSPIRSLAMGPVEIQGHIECWDNTFFVSPFTQRDCVLYSYTIQEQRSSGKNTHWVTIKQEQQMVHFLVRDDTGAVLINPRGAKVDVPHSFEDTSSIFDDPPLEVQRFLKIHNLSHESLFGLNKTMRYTEKILEPGQQVYVYGTADDNPFVAEGTAQKNVEDVMIQQGPSKFFVISNNPESKLLRKYTWTSYGLFILGFLFVIGGVIILIGR